MTALAGFWSFAGTQDAAQSCGRMLNAQQVYAPAAPAVRARGPVGLGRRLFSLLPEDRHDRGPVEGEGGSLLVADIRLDNRDELCALLGIPLAHIRSLADASVLMLALERWGEEAVDHVMGDFAFAWWRESSATLVLARDFAGHRPLHYHCGDGFFALASMPKGLFALHQVSRAPNRTAVAEALALMPETGSHTFFEGVEKVIPGEVVTVTRNGVSRRRYWDPAPRPLRLRDGSEYAEALREQMDRAVATRLRGAAAGVASHLSGGLDSSSVTATAARLLAGSGATVTAFTSVPREGYREPQARDSFIDEGPLAATVAAMHPNIVHVPIPSAAMSPVAEMERSFFLYDRPLVNPCNHVWHRAILDEAKRRNHAVLLTGAHGNASISYSGMPHLTELLRGGRLVRLAHMSLQLRSNGMRWGTIGAQALGPFLPAGVWRRIQRMRGAEQVLGEYSAISHAAAASVARQAAERGLDFAYRPRADALEARLWMFRRVDQGNFHKGDLARWGIDIRDPTADRRLVEFCLSVPVEHFLAGGRPRALARHAFADRLPAQILEERRKGFQAADWHEGLTAARAEIAEDVERAAEFELTAGAMDLERLRALVADWPAGGWNVPGRKRRYRYGLLRGIGVARFARWAAGTNS